MSTVYIGIGSNLGDRQKNIEMSLERLSSRRNIEVDKVSSIIETEPVGGVNQPRFLNAVCRIETMLYPDELLSVLSSIEKELGRDRCPSAKRLSAEEQLNMLSEDNLDIESLNSAKSGFQAKGRQEDVPVSLSSSQPRSIDLDILFYDDIIMKGNNLVIPHPRLHERVFVLRPLSEIAADLLHPVLKRTINDLLLEHNKVSDEDNKEP